MTDQAIELPPEISDEEAFEFAASLTSEVERMLAQKNADVLRYLLQMATLEARRLAATAACARRGVQKDRTTE